MAGDAVIIDDGGSTRIKQIKGNVADGKLDDLLSPGHSDNAKDTFSTLTIRYFDKGGSPGGPITVNGLVKGDTLLVESGNEQVLTIDVGNGGRLSLTLSSPSSGVEPLVHAKQNGQQRRYVVSNAGSIEKVKFNGASKFDTTDPNKPEHGSIYTMLALT